RRAGHRDGARGPDSRHRRRGADALGRRRDGDVRFRGGRAIVVRATSWERQHMELQGLHHITMITGDAQKNVDFYADTLGLRLVKKTVNFDQRDAYHLYFGDRQWL